MPRKGHIAKREKLPDPKFNDMLVERLINSIMLDGKKSIAGKIVYGAFDLVESRVKEEGLKVFHKAMDNIKPELEVKARRVGGATYQVPVEVRLNRKLSLGVRWLVRYAKGRSERTMIEKLAGEIIDAYNNKGGSVKKREDTHKMAEANKAFAHYRW
ncbi:30S ribosomal protein S7 [Syntrophorhabdus aromaticivorans]|jgi:small subunit ribosomal protein S7|uniref:Small ribosomal subunit protein uS7 n=1 Tax=Syntrophorhabdus aromaticivorans TaxID=328301 RepID=A0A971M503_9BACT|nr:30S ribosomal protein S7 [Syntrophorhabdus aromaticivorans]NLW35978.1 30S ribosomal protein S7 [Syntrophorhabdus aromaticivorans]